MSAAAAKQIAAHGGRWGVRNIGNALLCVLAIVPVALAANWGWKQCGPALADGVEPETWTETACEFLGSDAHPLLAVNLLFALGVDVLFWLIGLAQGSFWLIDPYWTLLPPLMMHYFMAHPHAFANATRRLVVCVLVWLWSSRLTHSYFRRENWLFGAREDWRFETMRADYGSSWWFFSLFVVFVSQQLMLVGVVLPVWAVNNSDAPWTWLDIVATVGSFAGIMIAYLSDTALASFKKDNDERKASGQATLPLLFAGPWRYSRHPNYFGETLHWCSIAMFGVLVGQWWTVVGAIFNTVVLLKVSSMTEAKMVQDERRAAIYACYQQTTSLFVMLPSSADPYDVVVTVTKEPSSPATAAAASSPIRGPTPRTLAKGKAKSYALSPAGSPRDAAAVSSSPRSAAAAAATTTAKRTSSPKGTTKSPVSQRVNVAQFLADSASAPAAPASASASAMSSPGASRRKK